MDCTRLDYKLNFFFLKKSYNYFIFYIHQNNDFEKLIFKSSSFFLKKPYSLKFFFLKKQIKIVFLKKIILNNNSNFLKFRQTNVIYF